MEVDQGGDVKEEIKVEIKVEVVDLTSDGEDDPVAVAARRYLRLLEETKEARKNLVTMKGV